MKLSNIFVLLVCFNINSFVTKNNLTDVLACSETGFAQVINDESIDSEDTKLEAEMMDAMLNITSIESITDELINKYPFLYDALKGYKSSYYENNTVTITEMMDAFLDITSLESITDELINKYPILYEVRGGNKGVYYENDIVTFKAENYTGILYFCGLQIEKEKAVKIDYSNNATNMELVVVTEEGDVIRLNNDEETIELELPVGNHAFAVIGYKGAGDIDVIVNTDEVSLDIYLSLKLEWELMQSID